MRFLGLLMYRFVQFTTMFPGSEFFFIGMIVITFLTCQLIFIVPACVLSAIHMLIVFNRSYFLKKLRKFYY